MKKRTKEKLRSKLFPILIWASFNQVPMTIVEKIWRWYIKFLEIFFIISTSITFTIAFTWFFPIYLNRGYELSITILLCIIVLWLKYGTITIQYKEEDE